MDPGSVIVVYNDDLKVKKLLRLKSNKVNVKFKIIKDGRALEIPAEAVCPERRDALCDIFMLINLEPLSSALLLIEESVDSLVLDAVGPG